VTKSSSPAWKVRMSSSAWVTVVRATVSAVGVLPLFRHQAAWGVREAPSAAKT